MQTSNVPCEIERNDCDDEDDDGDDDDDDNDDDDDDDGRLIMRNKTATNQDACV